MNIVETGRGVRFEVKVLPRSSRNKIAGELQGALRVKLTAPPVEGEANEALISFLAGIIGVPRKNILLVRGGTSRNKLVEITGVSQNEIRSRLGLGTTPRT